MKKDLITVATTALGVAALTVAMFGGGSSEAGREANGPEPKIAIPKFVPQPGVELTLTAKDGKTFKGGDQPVFELTAVNTTDHPADVLAMTSMSGTSPARVTDRGTPLPAILWQSPVSFTLKAGETKVMTVASRTVLPTNSFISVWLREAPPATPNAPAPNLARTKIAPGPGLSGIVALNFSTVNREQRQMSVASVR